MQSILCVYDIADSLKIPNPSAVFRKYGYRVNLSCWIFPRHLAPTTAIERLRDAGAVVHLINFAAEDQDKILDLARAELQRHAKKMIQFVNERVAKVKKVMDVASLTDNDTMQQAMYKKWRSVIATGKRELLAAEQCAFGFQISHDVEEALAGLKSLLASELSLALAARDRLKQQGCLDGSATWIPVEAAACS